MWFPCLVCLPPKSQASDQSIHKHTDSWLNRIFREALLQSLAHTTYGRAAIRLDGKELVVFSWVEMYHQEADTSELWKVDRQRPYDEMVEELKPKWDADCTYSEMDFLDAALTFRNMSIKDALDSENYIIKILAILDKRIGKRTLDQIKTANEYLQYPPWVQQFYHLRLS